MASALTTGPSCPDAQEYFSVLQLMHCQPLCTPMASTTTIVIIFVCICDQWCELKAQRTLPAAINYSAYHESEVLFYGMYLLLALVTLWLQASLSHLFVVQAVLSLAQYHEQASTNQLLADHKTFGHYCTCDLLVSTILLALAALLAVLLALVILLALALYSQYN